MTSASHMDARMLRADDDFWAFSGDDEDGPETLVDVLDRLLDRGVVVMGDLTISVAGVDLLFVGLKAFIASADRMEDAREQMLAKMRGEAPPAPAPLGERR
ncbi:MAG: gas vesicle protein [Pseudomonadota bacterium]